MRINYMYLEISGRIKEMDYRGALPGLQGLSVMGSAYQLIPKFPESAAGKKTEREEKKDRKPRVQLPAHMEPTFYIGGGNGNAMIEENLTALGWKRTKDKLEDNYRMKWCEVKSQINYNTFREGDQMVNHIPNCNLLTNKLGLLNSLQEYDRVCQAVKKRSLKLDFIPETYRLDDPRDREAFLETYKEGEIWINKPTGRNQGKGIYLIRNMDEIKAAISEKETEEEEDSGKPRKPLNRIVQRYIHKPLLLENKKFDIRAYMLVASTVPFLVLYHKGYVRLSITDYDMDTENLVAHLTNQFIQKKDPTYKEVKEETVWSMDRFNTYINENVAEEKGLTPDWVNTTLVSRMKQIMTYCFTSVKHKLQRKVGYFDLYGLDFMVDEEMKIWLIEVNVNPCLAINCEALRAVVPGVVKETLYVAIECFEKSRKGRALMPLQQLKNFQILYNGGKGGGGGRGNNTSSPAHRQGGATPSNRSQSTSPVRRTRSLSPVKEPGGEGRYAVRGAGRVTLRSTPTAPGTQPRPGQGGGANGTQGRGGVSGQPIREQGQRANSTSQGTGSSHTRSTGQSQTGKLVGSGTEKNKSPYSPEGNSSPAVTLKMTHASQRKQNKVRPAPAEADDTTGDKENKAEADTKSDDPLNKKDSDKTAEKVPDSPKSSQTEKPKTPEKSEKSTSRGQTKSASNREKTATNREKNGAKKERAPVTDPKDKTRGREKSSNNKEKSSRGS